MVLVTEVIKDHYHQLKVFKFSNKEKVIKYFFVRIKGPKFNSTLPRPLSKNQITKILKNIKQNKIKWIGMRNLSIMLLMWVKWFKD